MTMQLAMKPFGTCIRTKLVALISVTAVTLSALIIPNVAFAEDYQIDDYYATGNNVSGAQAGGVDVTPLSAIKLDNGDVRYRFRVSLSGLRSSGHIQTANVFHVAMPPMVKDVQFSLAGAYRYTQDWQTPFSGLLKNAVSSYIDENGKEQSVEIPFEILKPTKENSALKLVDQAMNSRAELLKEYYNTHPDEHKAIFGENKYIDSDAGVEANHYYFSTTTLNTVKAVRAAGKTELPGGVIDAGYDYGKFEGQIHTAEEVAELEASHPDTPKVKSYLLSSSSPIQPAGVNVEYTISAEQAAKTPVMPLWAALAWRSFYEWGIGQYDSGSQNLYDFPDTAKDFAAISDPTTIQNSVYDINGLYGTDTGVTEYTGSWSTIGSDITPAVFNYARTFNLFINPGVTYLIARADDHRDIAAIAPDVDLSTLKGPESTGSPYWQPGHKTPRNVVSNEGGVDVTPLKAELVDGKVKYSYQISLAAITSSDHIQTGDTFNVVVPRFADDVHFTQIGTFDIESINGNNPKPQPQDIELPLEMIVPTQKAGFVEQLEAAYAKRAKILKDYLAKQGKTVSDEDALKQITDYAMTATADEYAALKDAGVKELPGGVIDANLDQKVFNGSIIAQERREPVDENEDSFKSYIIQTRMSRVPVGLRLEFTVPEEQAKKTPNLPVFAALAWRGFSETLPTSHESGGQNLYEYTSTEQDVMFLAHPELINDNQFDENGLRGTSTGLTGYTGTWSKIGNDVSMSTFNYTKAFNLSINPGVTYIATDQEDYRDIAAVHYEPNPGENPDKDKPNPDPDPNNPGPNNPGPNNPGPNNDPRGHGPNGKGRSGLAKTGVSIGLTSGAAILLMGGGIVLLGRRRFWTARH